VQFDDTAPQIRRPAPGIGQDSGEILLELGYSGDDVTAFMSSGAVAGEPKERT
jgi:crotonobetainyl-CoA:carnitine CoA-transferase CaiB-like acyl-CoA transferase